MRINFLGNRGQPDSLPPDDWDDGSWVAVQARSTQIKSLKRKLPPSPGYRAACDLENITGETRFYRVSDETSHPDPPPKKG